MIDSGIVFWRGRRSFLSCLAILVGLGLGSLGHLVTAQDPDDDGLEREAPPTLEEFETDRDGDGTPDLWYNLRDAKMVPGGVVGSKSLCLRFESDRTGRPARASRGFGLDGRKTEAIIVGLWVRQENIGLGERDGDEPGLVIDFLGKQLRATGRGRLGPWTRTIGPKWVHVSRRIAVPPGTRDAILSVGLIGATGVLEIDGLTVQEIPVGGTPTTNLVLNGDFELGDPDPASWIVNNGAHRTSAGGRSGTVVELPRTGSKVLAGLAPRMTGLGALEIQVKVRGQNLRGASPAGLNLFFVDDDGRLLPGNIGTVNALTWSGSFEWINDKAVVQIPGRASHAVIQIEKMDRFGTLWVDDVQVRRATQPDLAEWTPYHTELNTTSWAKVTPSEEIHKGTALDVSNLLEAPAGKHGFVQAKGSHLSFADGQRARFFGVSMLYPTTYIEADHAEEFADRLARSGVNLVRLGDLDYPTGPGRSLFDDTRDDTKALDPMSLGRLDHLIAVLKSRGIYVALELQSGRRFRVGDGIDGFRYLPSGGGPAAAFDPTIRELEIQAAKALFNHVNPETGLAWKDEPAIAWVTLAGELSLFDLLEDTARTVNEDAAVRSLSKALNLGTGRRNWQVAEANQWKAIAEALRSNGVKVPIAGSSHWRREPEFNAAQAGNALDLIDDRLFWTANSWITPEHRSMLWSTDGGLATTLARKRLPDKPFVLGQWCNLSQNAWATNFEAGDFLLGSFIAADQGYDALVRRGVFFHPSPWGSAAAGTGGGEDIFALPEVINGMPQVFSLFPHAANLLLRSGSESSSGHTPKSKTARSAVHGWEPRLGRLRIDTPHTQGMAGWTDSTAAVFPHATFETDDEFAVVVASSLTSDPIPTSKRLLLTAVGRVVPTGFRWNDPWMREAAHPGTPPLLQEPIKFKFTWRREGTVKAFALDNNGDRVREVKLVPAEGGVRLDGDCSAGNLHWELVVD